MRRERFERTGLLAIEPRALLEIFSVPDGQRVNQAVGTVQVIEITGPLIQRSDWWCDSYEDIRARVRAACAVQTATAVMLRIDSPGGDVPGCFETARAIRDECARAKKPLLAYIDKACSAAYALASAAGIIGIGETCCAGSIGVLSSRPDYTAQNTQRGVRIEFVSSGARKLDGNPDYPVSAEELAVTQRQVDELAQKFFALIGEHRPQLSAATIGALEGGVLFGEAAVSAGLADGVTTFEALLTAAGRGDMQMIFQAKSEYDVARAALEKVAKGTDANASAAKRALAAMAESEPPKEEEEPAAEEEKEEEPAAEEPEEEPAAQAPAASEGGEPPADKKPAPPAAAAPAASAPEGAAPAAAAPVASAAPLTLEARLAQLERKEAARERAQLLASRPDLSVEMKRSLSKLPLANVREVIKAMPKAQAPAAQGGARKPPITTVPAARGAANASTPSAEASEMDRRMGLSTQRLGCRKDGNTLYFGVVADEDSNRSVH